MRWCMGLAASGLIAFTGCQDSGQGSSNPADVTARKAVEESLARWRDGQTRPERFLVDKTWVEVLNQSWSAGEKIRGFTIVSEETGGNGPRIYTVKLHSSKGDETVKFYVIGTDPLWVYSEPDYKRMSGGS